MRLVDPVSRALARRWHRLQSHTILPPTTEAPEYPSLFRRPTQTADGHAPTGIEPSELDDVRARMVDRAMSYRREARPGYKLLYRVPAGAGKTHAMVLCAGVLSGVGDTIAYAVARHNMYPTLLDEAVKVGIPARRFHEWQPRRGERDGQPATCKHADHVGTAVEKGYEARDFCVQVRGCGWSYIAGHTPDGGCPYWGQQRAIGQRGASIVVVQHQHLFLGHPLWASFDMVIGDENPVDAVKRVWRVPWGSIVPRGVDPQSGLALILEKLRALAVAGQRLFGRTLIDAIGGAPFVHEVCRKLARSRSGRFLMSGLREPTDVLSLDYCHVPSLCWHLARESRAYLDGLDYAARVIVEPNPEDAHGAGCLTLLARHDVTWRSRSDDGINGYPDHMIWLDGTADPRYYETLFGAPFEVFDPLIRSHATVVQITDRQNGIGAVFEAATDEHGKRVRGARAIGSRAQELVQQVGYLSRWAMHAGMAVGVVTFKDLRPLVEPLATPGALGRPMVEHFGGARGTNNLVSVDALIVAGTPNPPEDEIHTLVRCLIQERMDAFVVDGRLARVVVDRSYAWTSPEGTGISYPTTYYADADVAAVHWQMREAELIQAVGRARGVLKPVTIYLLTNLPIDQVAPHHVLSLRQLYDAPDDVNVYEWARVQDAALRAARDCGVLLSTDLVREIGCERSTAVKYVERLRRQYPGEWRYPDPDETIIISTSRRGRPPTGIISREKYG